MPRQPSCRSSRTCRPKPPVRLSRCPSSWGRDRRDPRSEAKRLVEEGRLDEALAPAAKGWPERSPELSVLLLRVRQAEEVADPDTAIALLTEAHALAPDDDPICVRLADLLKEHADTGRHWKCCRPTVESQWHAWTGHLRIIDTLDIPDVGVKARARADADLYSFRITSTHVRARTIHALLGLAGLGVVLAGSWWASWAVIDARWSSMPAEAAVCAFLGFLITFVQMMLNTQARGGYLLAWTPWLLVVLGLAALTMTGAYQPDARFDAWPDGALVMLLAHAVQWPVLLVGNAIVVRITSLRLARCWQRQPRAAILDQFAILLDWLPARVSRNDLDARAEQIGELEWTAKRLEQDLPAKLVADGDSRTSGWAKERADGAATAVRDLKRHLIAPKEGSWEVLERELRRSATLVAVVDFGALRWTAPPSAGEKRRDKRRIALEVARAIAVMAAPLVTILLLGSWLGLDATVLGWAKLIGLGWAALYFLLAMDPSIRDKIDLVSPLMGVGRSRDGEVRSRPDG